MPSSTGMRADRSSCTFELAPWVVQPASNAPTRKLLTGNDYRSVADAWAGALLAEATVRAGAAAAALAVGADEARLAEAAAGLAATAAVDIALEAVDMSVGAGCRGAVTAVAAARHAVAADRARVAGPARDATRAPAIDADLV